MKSCERKLGRKHYDEGFPSSNKLTTAAKEIFKTKAKIRNEQLKLNRCTKTIKQQKKELENKYKQLRKCQKDSAELRKEHLYELANKKATIWNVKVKQAIAIIEEAEQSRQKHKRHRYYVKPESEANIRHLLVPKPTSKWKISESDITNIKCQTRVDDPIDIFNILLRQNYRHLLKSQKSIFTTKHVREKIGWNAENEIVESILQGIDNDKIYKDLANGDEITHHFLKALQYSKNKNEEQIKQFQWTYGVDEYKSTFSKTRENTACGPSGLHMSHWKALLESHRLMRVHSFYIWAAFTLSFSYPRWEVSWHCMLKKKQHPYSQKLRIIQLFEGDFNGALNYLLGRRLMQHATKEGLFDKETFGSRLGKSAIEALLTLQLIFDNHRIWKKNIAMLFNDADGCYDRIPPNLADLALQRIGCPKSIARTHTITQRKMKHFVKTASGVSKGYIKFGEKKITEMLEKCNNTTITISIITTLIGPIGGVGQGGGASPIIWLAILLVMLLVYRKFHKGVEIIDRITLTILVFWILSYVDDNTIIQSFHNEATLEVIIDEMRKCIMTWNRLLQLTGGDLSLSKCKVSILKWKQNYWGISFPSSMQDNANTITITHESGTKEDTIERINPWEAERVLGLRIPMTGEMNTELKYRVKQSTTLATRLYAAPFTPHDAYTVYNCRYKSMIRYCLPVTTFTEDKLNEIQKKFIYLLLPKLGINRHAPRAMIYGPLLRGGRGIMDLRTEQPIQHIMTNLGHMRRGDSAGQLLRVTLNDTQLETGLERPFFQYDYEYSDYTTTNTRWRYMWYIISKYNLNLRFYQMWTPHRQYKDDKNIMESAIMDNKYSKRSRFKLQVINNCRMFLGVIYLSELTNVQGNILKEYINGTSRQCHTKYNYPKIRRPPKAAWNEWKSFLFRNFLNGACNINPPLTYKKNEEKDEHKTILRSLNEIKKIDDLGTMVNSLPLYLKKIVGSIDIPQDNGKSLVINSADEGIILASDGSLVEQGQNFYGGHGYSIQRQNTDEGRIIGRAATPRSTEMTSLTTELHGIIANLVILKLLEKKHDNLQTQYVFTYKITADNKEALKKGNEVPLPLNIGETLKGDYDLWKLMHEIQQSLRGKVKYIWVKGHQDEVNGKKVFGPFNRATQLNIEMDKEANIGRLLNRNNTIYRDMNEHTIYSLYTNDGMMVTNVRRYIENHINGPKLEEYLMGKFGWNIAHIKNLNWPALEKALRKQTSYRRTKLCQLMYNWQNTGQQKQQMHNNDGLCPTGCGEQETHLHYLHCNNAEMKKHRLQQLQHLNKRMEKIKTYAGIKANITNIIMNQYANIPLPTKCNTLADKYINEAINEQKELGATSLEKGFMPIKWQMAQEAWTNEMSNNNNQWEVKIIQYLQDYTYSIWKKRNEFIHGQTVQDSNKEKKKQLQQKVKELYKKDRGLLTHRERIHFNLPLEQRLKGGIDNLTSWIKLMELIFENSG